MEVLRLAAFSAGSIGGNPAGVVLADVLPEQPVNIPAVKDSSIKVSRTARCIPEIQ